MGLILDTLKHLELGPESDLLQNQKSIDTNNNEIVDTNHKGFTELKFPDLEAMPQELSLQILKNLNATDLCLAACVWSSLANDDILWRSLCTTNWRQATIYNKNLKDGGNFRYIFMQLDEATLTFNADWKKVIGLNGFVFYLRILILLIFIKGP